MFEHWEEAQATVIDRVRIADKGASAGYSATARFKYVVEVQSAHGQTFRDEVKDSAWTDTAVQGHPGIGATIPVLVDFRRKKVKLPAEDASAAANGKAIRDEAREHYDASLAGEPGSTAPMSATLSQANAMLDALQLMKTDPVAGRAAVAAAGGHVAAFSQGDTVEEPVSDTAAELVKLADLRSKGLLTDAEFTAAKQKLLGL
jgi:Short C-terminal domain